MNRRETIRAIVARQPTDRCGLWLGNPHQDTWPILHEYFGTDTEEDLRRKLGDDVRWIAPWSCYRHPAGKPMFDMQRPGKSLSEGGVFADCESVQEVEDFEWPNPDYLDFGAHLDRLRNAGDVYRAGGFWSPFFHQAADFFGMENYFVKMYTHPEVVHAVTRHMVDFYLEANKRLFTQAAGEIDAFFFGNDFGTQLDLLISPACFDEFVFPYFRKLTELGHRHGLQVILHSCGAIHSVIPQLIDLGVDALHPLQAKAASMDAQTLAGDFGGRVAFMGAVDTQDLLVNATPAEVADDVRRVKDLLGPSLIVSPSHEAVLPNVPPENIEAMARAAAER
ncbi:MAG: uroporphyrinogen decarboxylase family protein [Verrucomicrobiota bacterium]